MAEILIIGESPDRKSNRRIGVQRFANPEDKTSGALEVPKSREVISTVHLEGTHGSDRSFRERSR